MSADAIAMLNARLAALEQNGIKTVANTANPGGGAAGGGAHGGRGDCEVRGHAGPLGGVPASRPLRPRIWDCVGAGRVGLTAPTPPIGRRGGMTSTSHHRRSAPSPPPPPAGPLGLFGFAFTPALLQGVKVRAGGGSGSGHGA